MMSPRFIAWGLIFAALRFLWFASYAYGASIVEITPSPVRVSKGDLVTLEVQPSDGVQSIEWWSDGRVICQKIRCDIDTSQFTPGEYRFDVVVADDDGVALGTVAVSADDAAPLHVPRNIAPVAMAPREGYAFVKRGQWLLVPRAGIITAMNDRSPSTKQNITTATKLLERFTYAVGTGSQAIIRQVGSSREWFVAAPSTFRLKGDDFQLITGKALFRETKVSSGSDSPHHSYLANVKISTTGAALVGVELQPVKGGQSKLVSRNFAGNDAFLACSPTEVISVRHAEARVVELNANGSCAPSADIIEQTVDPTSWVTSWMPWWIRSDEPVGADRWRAERQIWQTMLSHSELSTLSIDALKNHTCPDLLDAIFGGRNFGPDNEISNRASADCLFDLGMYRASLQKYKLMESKGQMPDWTAFMIGRSYQMMSNPRQALEWYDLAERRGFTDRAMLGQFAAKSALDADQSKDRLRWLETAAVYNKDASSTAADWHNATLWRKNRPRGAKVGMRFYMDGQALPINSKKSPQMPAGASTSRSTVYEVDGSWWSEIPVTMDGLLKIVGTHSFSKPYIASLSIGQKSIHELAGGFQVGEAKKNLWKFEGGFRVGTGISGSERQRDRLGWYAQASKEELAGFYVGVDSSKYLDPNPAGADLLDLDLNRFTGEADHSHLDLLVVTGMKSQVSMWALSGKFEYGLVDYRTGIIDQFDHTFARVSMTAQMPLSHVSTLVLCPGYFSRDFKDLGGTEQDSSIDFELRFRTAPLWTALLTARYESRAVSADESVSYNRHTYGLALVADL